MPENQENRWYKVQFESQESGMPMSESRRRWVFQLKQRTNLNFLLPRRGFPGSVVKNFPDNTRVRGLITGSEYPREKEMATNSSILARKIPMDRGAWWVTTTSLVVY